jgi:hypothetical protein
MGKLFLTYNNEEIQDGFFAQVQRIMAIYSISQRFKINYYHSKITYITVTQLDVIQSENEIANFLNQTNKMFENFNFSDLPNEYEIILLSLPKLRDIIKYFMISKILNKNIVLKITNPYGVIERIPSAYKYAINSINLTTPIKSNHTTSVVVHIRRGVTIQHVIPGEGKPRAMNDDYYLSVLRRISKKFPTSTRRVIILTDAPKHNLLYEPSKKDLYKWKEFADRKFKDGISIDGHEFSGFKSEYSEQLEIVRGGDLIKSLKLMINADHLIMSRSSMSYVGALLNKKGVVFYPPDFWHKPLKKWIKVT